MKTQTEQFVKAYLAAAIWSSTYENEDGECVPMDDKYSTRDISASSIFDATQDCIQFINANGIPSYGDPEYSDAEKAGHDFWLTRNHHGAGFWDRRELSMEDKARLMEASHSFREVDLIVGDDGELHFE